MGERLSPGPCNRTAQGRDARTADEASWHREAPGAHGARHGELVGGGELAERGGPADEVMGQGGAEEPGRIGEELPGGHVLETGPFFEVSDGQLDAGMGAVEGIDVDDVSFEGGRSKRRSGATRAKGSLGVRRGGCGAR